MPGAIHFKMDLQLPPPDLAISLFPDRFAPRAARYCVGTIQTPPPQLRDSVVLLTSEVVSRAVRLHGASSHDLFELRVWMREEVARVELRAPRELVCAMPAPEHQLDDEDQLDDLQLIEILADRWSIDADEQEACIWFEIDCHRGGGQLDERSRGWFSRVGHRFPIARTWARPRRSCAPATASAAPAFRRNA